MRATFLDGAATCAQLSHLARVAADQLGTLYVADEENCHIRKIDRTGAVSTWAGDGTAGSADGPGSRAELRSPVGIALDWAGNAYLADFYNNTIRKIASEGSVTTLAGSGLPPG